MKRVLIAFLLMVLLVACGRADKSNIRPPEDLAPLSSNVEVERLWDVRVGDGADTTGVRMRPEWANGVLYAASVNGKLRAIDGTSGETIWQLTRDWHDDKDTSYAGGPVVEDGLLVIGTLDGHIFAMDAATGEQRWKAMLGAEVLSLPVIYQDLVLVRTGDGHVHALDIADGSSEWIYDRATVPLLSLRGNGGLLAAGGVVFFGTDDGRLVALRVGDGTTLWEQTVSTGEGRTDIDRLADADGRLQLEDDVLYAGAYHGSMLAVDAASGRPLWKNKFSTYTGFDVDGTTVAGVDDASVVWAYDTSSGANIWKQDGLKWRWLTAPAIQNDRLVVGGFEGYVHWLDLDTGEIVARAQLSNDPIRARPLIVDDMVFVADIAGHVAAYRLTSP